MNCKNCGAPISEGEKFCMNCGSPVATVERVEAETVETKDDFDSLYDEDYNTQSTSGYVNDVTEKKSSGKGLAIASMIFGILAFLCCCINLVGLLFGAIAIVLGIISIKSSGEGKGMAITGIVLGSLGALSGLVSIIFGMAMITSVIPGLENMDELEDIINQFSL